MNSQAAIAILLVVSACLVSSSNAWGWRSNSKTGSTGKNSSRGNTTYPIRTVTVVAVRRVDEDHPYFQSFDLRSSVYTLDRLKQNLTQFFNQTSNITRIVKNDHLLITRDADVRMITSRDYLEVWFQDSKAPTRSKTMYAFSKDARKATTWGGKSEKTKSTKSKSKSKSKSEKKTRRGDEDEDAEDERLFDMD